MKKAKLNFKELQGALNRTEMQKIMAGSGTGIECFLTACSGPCKLACGSGNTNPPPMGICRKNSWGDKCYCVGGC